MRIARITDPIAVPVGLGGIRDVRAHITRVAHTVAIFVVTWTPVLVNIDDAIEIRPTAGCSGYPRQARRGSVHARSLTQANRKF